MPPETWIARVLARLVAFVPHREDRTLPLAIRGRRIWLNIGFGLAILPIAGIAIILKFGPFPTLIAPLVAVIISGVILAGIAQESIRECIHKARLGQFMLCTRCMYDLRDSNEEGLCPECGRPYRHTATREAWHLAEERFKHDTSA